MSAAEEIFSKAAKSFRARLTSKELSQFQGTTLDDLRRLMLHMQSTQELVKNSMSMRRLERFLGGMSELGNILDVFLNNGEILCFIWGPIKFLLGAANTFMESFDSLLDAYQQLGLAVPRLAEYGELFGQHDDMNTLLAKIYEQILGFHQKAICFFRAKKWTKAFRAVWKDFESEFQETVWNIKQYRIAMQNQASLHMTPGVLTSRQDVMGRVYGVVDYVEERKKQFKQRERERHDDQMNKVQRWIRASPASQERHASFQHQRIEFCASRCENTGRWILEPRKEPNVHRWIWDGSYDHSMLWITGNKGTGKSFLASIIIDECLEKGKNDGTKTCYFYCQGGPADERSASLAVFKGLLSQLVCQCPDIVPCVFAKQTQSAMTITSTDAKTMLELFVEKQLYIIIDGLDECEAAERKQIVQWFTEKEAKSQAQADRRVRVLFVSQSLPDIRRLIQSPAVNARTIDLKPNDNFITNDIKTFVDAKVEDIARRKEFKAIDPQDAQRIRTATCRNARDHEGMFLFARLVMDNLMRQPTLRHLQQEVRENFPLKLKDAYDRIFARMKRDLVESNGNETVWDQAMKLLGWIACAKRSMRWHEVQAIMSLSHGHLNYQLDKFSADAKDLCGSLIHSVPGGGLEFVHSSARDYVLFEKSEYFDRSGIEMELTICCLRYLSLDCFSLWLSDETRQMYAWEGRYALQDYAIAEWMHHLAAVMEHLTKSGLAVHSEFDHEFATTLQEFTNRYHIGLGMDDFNTEEEKEKRDCHQLEAEQECAKFDDRPFYRGLLKVWTHVRIHKEASSKVRNTVSVPDLRAVMERSRHVLQGLREKERGMIQDRDDSAKLTKYYGCNFFKCDRVTCGFFWEGFETKEQLLDHINRHERPFSCIVEDCAMAKFGFHSNKDRERHMRAYHPDHPDAGPSPFIPLNRRKTGEAKFQCSLCSKSFTRNINLKSHLHNHFGEKPFSCGTCGKCFTRVNDCRRHEKIHTRRSHRRHGEQDGS